jgi:hypothetical protein
MSDKKPTPHFVKSEDFREVYANQVSFEPSTWDLKINFGLLDQSTTPHTVANT